MRGDDYNLREDALTALESIDAPVAAREVRPLLKTEPNLSNKLRIARLLARHDLADGYALATEHLADAGQTSQAALVLAALHDARTAKDLTAILVAKPDRRWHAAALTGLAAAGDAAARRQLQAILADDRHPLAADAATAAGVAGDADLIKPLVPLTQSRNRHLALSALVAVRRFVTDVRSSPLGLSAVDRDAEADAHVPGGNVPADTRTALATAAAALVTDAHVDADVRQEAFAVARLLRGDNYPKLLADIADQAELEGSQLLTAAKTELRRLHGHTD
jgi:hypothetical protein